MSVKVNGVSKFYGQQKALDKVSLEIGKGEIAGLLGPNGAGKSTLMKILTCFIPPDEGTASVNGCSIYDDPFGVRMNVGYLPENNPLYLDMFVHEFLLFVAGLHKINENRHKRVREMIEITGLQDEQHKKIGALSKGYRQRVGLAQAMIHNPDVLILDEPTSGLDPNQIVEIRNLIRTIGKEKTVLFSTHIMQEVEALCSRVIIINQGVIVADTPISELPSLTKGREMIKVEFDKKVNIDTLQKLDGVFLVTEIQKNTYHIESNPNKDVRSVLLQFASRNDLKIITLAGVERRLEEIFQQLTKK